MKVKRPVAAGLILLGTVLIGPACAADCQNTDSFEHWLDGFRQEASAQGIPQKTVSAALDGITFDPKIIAHDHNQGVFQQSFLQFSDRMVSSYRLVHGQLLMKKHELLFKQIEHDFGVPAPVLVAIWGLESDFGAVVGTFPTFRALATLAYDCRRSQEFRTQLLAALRLVDHGDLKTSEMVGDWAGELGPMQFPASDYNDFAVDYDGDGRRDLIRSLPDMLASTANFLAKKGWHRGEPWLQEVRVLADTPWQEADLAIYHPRSQWAKWSVMLADKTALPADELPASLLLPMGHAGPAFLAYENFRTYLRWNQSLVYATTAAYLATQLAGAPPVGRGALDISPLQPAQMIELQQLLIKHDYLFGSADGKLGRATRLAVKTAQLAFGLPADSYPTVDLLDQLRALP